MIVIAVFGNSYQSDKENHLQYIFERLNSINARILIDSNFYHFLKEKTGLNPSHSELIVDNDFRADIALSIGGDGTFLRTAEKVGDKNIPILGINTGRLGFLADVTLGDIDNALTELDKNDFRVEERTLLQLEMDHNGQKQIFNALNEIAILKRDNSSMITIHVDINGDYLNSYEADGLVIATPTGSTAYSLSAGGPILAPQASNFVLCPVAPHSLTTRPLVITDSCMLDIRTSSRTDAFQVAVDGHSYTVDTDQMLHISKAPYTIKVIKRNHYTFYDTLRDKLMWGADKRF